MQSAAKENAIYVCCLFLSEKRIHVKAVLNVRGGIERYLYLFLQLIGLVWFNTHTYMCKNGVFASILVNTVILKQTAEKENTCILDLGSS